MTAVDLEALHGVAERAYHRHGLLGADDAAAIEAAIAEIRRLRAIEARVEAAAIGDVVEIGDDTGQPRVIIHATRDALRNFVGPLLFGRVRLVAESGDNK